MYILPAIDIKDGACVRLYQGSFDTVHQVAKDPLETAQAFERLGARWLHMVDLDGADQGKAVHSQLFKTIAKETGLKIQAGGGIRSLDQIDAYLEHGIDRVIIGSQAIKEPAMVAEAVRLYGDAIAVGIDARDGVAYGEAWKEKSPRQAADLAKEMTAIGVSTLIYTDIAQDGTLLGPALDTYAQMKKDLPGTQIIASGGIRNLDDIQALLDLGLYGAICGKAIYAGTLKLQDAIALAQKGD